MSGSVARRAKYAEGTTVPWSRSRDEIERVLAKYEAGDHVVWDIREDAISVGFLFRDVPIRVSVRVPPRESYRKDPDVYWRERSDTAVAKLYDAERRRKFRVLLIRVKGGLEAVADDDATVAEAFLPYLLLPGGETLGGRLAPQLEDILTHGEMPELAPAPSALLALPPGRVVIRMAEGEEGE